MGKWKRLASGSVLLAGLSYALTAHAYPMPGYLEEVYVTYYSDAARTVEVGVRAISHDAACAAWHATWGSQTPYTRVSVVPCPGP